MPHQRPTVEVQEHGQVLYRRKDYTKALELFNQAISQETNPSPTLLDNRAATFEKLDDLKSALKDARTTIKLHEHDVTGYLRAGKLLQKMEKPEIALGIYNHGIKKKTKNVELLQKMYDRLSKIISPPTAVDPFAQLPIELVEMILAHLSFRQIVRCTGVSKQWRVFINSLPKLWTQVNLSESRRSVKNAFLSHCINTSKHQVSSATLKRLATPEKAITALVRSCRSLQTLRLIDGGLVSPDLVHQLQSARNLSCLVLGTEAPISLDTATLLLRDLPMLVQLECHHIEHRGNLSSASWKGEYPKLQRLKLVSGMQNIVCPALDIPSLMLRCPNLRSLSLLGWSFLSARLYLDQLKYLEELDLSRGTILDGGIPLPGLPPSIRCLRLAPSIGMMAPPFGADRYFLPNLEELRCFSLHHAAILLSNEGPHSELQHSESRGTHQTSVCSMRKLHLNPDDIWTHDDSSLSTILSLKRLEKVEELALRQSKSINDDIADILATQFKHLERVDFTQTAVTGYGVKQIIKNHKPGLQELTLTDCLDISPDAVEWARSQVVKVNYSMSDGHGNGRKLRN